MAHFRDPSEAPLQGGIGWLGFAPLGVAYHLLEPADIELSALDAQSRVMA